MGKCGLILFVLLLWHKVGLFVHGHNIISLLLLIFVQGIIALLKQSIRESVDSLCRDGADTPIKP